MKVIYTTLTWLNGTSIEVIEFSASVTEQHGFEVEVTEHPVETGADISDHARPKPATLMLEGIITNTPSERGGTASRLVSRGSAQWDTTSAEDHPADAPGAAEEALARLLELKDAGQLLSVVTSLKSYENMLITSLNIPRDGHTGDALQFSLALKEIRRVELKVTNTNVPAIAKSKTSKGKVAAPVTPPATVHGVDDDVSDGLGGHDFFAEKPSFFFAGTGL